MNPSFPRPVRAALAGALLATLALALPAAAQETAAAWPSKLIRLIVPYPTGGLPDTLARVLAQRMGESAAMNGAQVLVENKPGAGGILGTEFVARSAPDGYTVLIADLGQTAINLALYPKLSYDTLRDFAPVSMIGTSPFFLAVHQSSGIHTVAELIAQAKAKPGQLSYGSSGPGSPHHLAMETFKARTGTDILHVPYKGSGQSTPALIGGQIPMLFTVLSTVTAHVKTGTVRLVAVASPTRTPQAPDVPTFAELGVRDMLFLPSVAALAPAGTPAPIVAKISGEVARAVRHPDSLKRFESLGIDPVGNTPAEYAAQLRADIAFYAQAVKLSGAKAE